MSGSGFDDPPGTVVLSVDAEVGWGFHHLDPLPGNRVRRGREAWHRLLGHLDERDLPATWAVVGHLLLDSCPGGHAGHPAGPDCCRVGGGAVVPPEAVWFGRDLVRAVRDAEAGHEVASHGFTHVHFSHDAMDRGFADRELGRCRAAAADLDLSPTSFVFPVNEVGHRDLLADHGFTAYRGPSPTVAGGSLRRRGRKLLSAVGRGSPPVVTPSMDEHDLVDVPASLYLFGFDGPARALVERVREDPIVGAVRRGLDRLAREGGVLHLWLHPHDLAAPTADDRVRATLDAVARARDRDGVVVRTMGEVAARVREGTPASEAG